MHRMFTDEIVEFVEAEIVVEPGYAELEQMITQADNDTVEAFKRSLMLRWESGRMMLAERQANGGKQLPHGRMAELLALTGRSERELFYRMQFAEQYEAEEKVCTAVQTFSSWREVRKSLVTKPKPERKPKAPVVDTAGNPQPEPKREPVDVTPEPAPERPVTQSNQPDPKDAPEPVSREIAKSNEFDKLIETFMAQVTIKVSDYRPKSTRFGPQMIQSMRALITVLEQNIAHIEDLAAKG